MSDGLFFYFMKVGAGNAFMGFTEPEQLGELDKREGLFVGYYNKPIPKVHDRRSTPTKKGEKEDKELLTLAIASQEALRSRSIACVFTDSHLTFWKITDDFRVMPANEVKRFAKIDKKQLNGALDYDKDWKRLRNQGGGTADAKAFFRGCHWLPARLLKVIPRQNLLAPADSLRVHRWLNSGTFRSMHSITGNGLMDDIAWLKKIEPLDPGDICSRTKETPYAKLVRQYLTGLIRPSTRISLNDGQLAELASLWINPAQLETVGALLALDLGFTLEVGLGKGQDVVDIKASLGHLEGAEKKAAIKSVLERLEKVLKVSMTPAFRERITKDGIFWVQCKAQDLDEGPSSVQGPNPDLVLTLMPGAGKETKTGQLYLSRLMECVVAQPKDFRHLSNWQRVYVNQIRQGMCGSKEQV